MATITFGSQSPAELRAAADKCEAEKEASFQRCDTDGFASQWANGVLASVYSLQARIVEAGGVCQFKGLYEGTRRVAAKDIEGQYGYCWLLRDDEAAKLGRKFIPDNAPGKPGRIQKQLGLIEREETAPAKAIIKGSGHGFSGTAYAGHVRTGDEWGLDSTPTA